MGLGNDVRPCFAREAVRSARGTFHPGDSHASDIGHWRENDTVSGRIVPEAFPLVPRHYARFPLQSATGEAGS